MVEQYNYPYKEGEYGIPFSQVNENGVEQIVRSGSGRRLVVDLTHWSLHISDYDEFYFKLNANVVKNTLYLQLRTSDEDSLLKKHPDLFAGKFLDYAFSYFSALGTEINCAMGRWYPWSDNYEQFENSLKVQEDELVAVSETWTGRNLKRHGLFPIRVVRQNNGAEQYILSTFEKS